MSVDNLGPIETYPKDGVASYYFPLKEGAIAPLVAVRFTRLSNGMLLFVKCKVVDTSARDDQGFERILQIQVN